MNAIWNWSWKKRLGTCFRRQFGIVLGGSVEHVFDTIWNILWMRFGTYFGWPIWRFSYLGANLKLWGRSLKCTGTSDLWPTQGSNECITARTVVTTNSLLARTAEPRRGLRHSRPICCPEKCVVKGRSNESKNPSNMIDLGSSVVSDGQVLFWATQRQHKKQ